MPVPEDLSIGEVAAIVGVQPHTLRAWERRYGIVRPRRSPRNQRRYTVEDVELLIRLKAGIGGGTGSIRQAAEMPSARQRSPRGEVGEHDDDGGEGSVWRSALDLVPIVVLLLDGRGRIVDANGTAARAMGLTRHELRGRHLRDLVVPDDRARAGAVCRAPMAQRSDYPLAIMAADGPLSLRFDCRPLPPTSDRRLMVLVGY